MTILYGHRGNKDIIEKKMIAFNKCKYEGIETTHIPWINDKEN